MILSDMSIESLIEQGDLVIDPLPKADCLQGASVDFHIGDEFLTITEGNGIITFDTPVGYTAVKKSRFILPPHGFALATTQEYLALPNYLTAFVEGRSSIGRLGLFIQNAGWIDPGFEGRVTLELFNATALPIEIRAGQRAGQFVFARMDRNASQGYAGKYQKQKSVTGSRLYMDAK